MKYRKRLLTAIKALLLLACLAVTGGLSAIAGLQIAIRTREISTPDLRGQTVQEARSALQAVGLRLRIDPLRQIDPSIEAGRVAIQDPSAGATTRRRRTVKLWLSSGAMFSTFPILVGESEQGAKQTLTQQELALRTVSEIQSNQYPVNIVVAQETLSLGNQETMSLLVNRGQSGRTYVMPNLIGVNGTEAANILRTRGFRVTVVGDHPYPGIPVGVVLRQAPQAGFQISPSQAISLEVSR